MPSLAEAQTETIEYYGQDLIGSIRIVFSPTGTVLARQDYDPFGRRLVAAPTTPQIGLGAQTKDEETQSHYFHARMYSDRIGRFTRPDPIRGSIGAPQRWNRYAYALNNPASVADYSGLWVPPSDPCVEVEGPVPSGGCNSGDNGSALPDGDERDGKTDGTDSDGDSGTSDQGDSGTQQIPPQIPPKTPPPTPTPAPTPAPAAKSPRLQLACSADVALNFGLGFIPGYNGLLLGLDYFNIQLTPAQYLMGSNSFFSGGVTPVSTGVGLVSTGDLFASTNYQVMGGQAAQRRFADLINRRSFKTKSASAQVKMLAKASSLSKAAKVASAFGTVANFLNVASAGVDLYSCWHQ